MHRRPNSTKKNFSILQKANKISIEHHPFPHIIIHDALPQDLANYLTSNFPFSSFHSTVNNARHDIPASRLSEIENLPIPWKEFIEFHTSKEFFAELIKIFGHAIVKMNHGTFPSISSLLNMRVGTRNLDSTENCDIYLDAQISTNSAVTSISSVREIHVDHTNKLFSGMLYLRQPDDDSNGGNLNLYQWKEGYTHRDKLKYYKESLDSRHVDLYKQVTYKNNTCIIFLNSIDALHAVTPREITNHQRTFVNFIGELPYDIFIKRNFFIRIFQRCKALIRKLKNAL